MKNSQLTDRPQLTWVLAPTAQGGTRLEMRWDVAAATVAPATTHAA